MVIFKTVYRRRSHTFERELTLNNLHAKRQKANRAASISKHTGASVKFTITGQHIKTTTTITYTNLAENDEEEGYTYNPLTTPLTPYTRDRRLSDSSRSTSSTTETVAELANRLMPTCMFNQLDHYQSQHQHQMKEWETEARQEKDGDEMDCLGEWYYSYEVEEAVERLKGLVLDA